MGVINLVDPATGQVRGYDEVADANTIVTALRSGWEREAPRAAATRTVADVTDEQYSGFRDKIGAAAGAFTSGATAGLSDVAAAGLAPDLAELMGRQRRASPITSGISEGAGAVVSVLASGGTGALGSAARLTPASRVSALGRALARTAPEAGAAAKIGRGVLGGVAEGALQSAGSAASDLALSKDRVSMDRIFSSMGSAFLYGAAIGGVGGGALRGLEVTASATGRRVAASRATADKLGDIPEDLAGLDKKALRARDAAETARLEAERVPLRAKVADDVNAYREATKLDTPWTAVASGTKLGKKASKAAKAAADAAGEAYVPAGAAPRWVRETEKIYVEADKYLDRVLRNPKRLAADPKGALGALQQQEHALEVIVERSDELRALHATDRSGRRAAALDAVPKTLEANRALQRRITDLGAPLESPQLAAITNARDVLDTPKKKTLTDSIVRGSTYTTVAGIVSGVPLIGPVAAPFIASRAADFIGDKLAGKFAGVTRQAAERTVKAVEAFTSATRKAQRVAPVLASKVLAAARFGDEKRAEPETGSKGRQKGTLLASFEARASEVAKATTPGPTGAPVVRPKTRAAIAERLAGIAAVAPHISDRLETHAVRRLEFLASKMPRVTQIGMTRIPPAEMEIRAWARYVAAADDPGAIEERLAAGTITPEDAEVMRELYPDRMADITRQIVEKIGTLRETLPYHRRVALSIFTGVPVDAAMDPRILPTLQAQFEEEEGTEGGTSAPLPQASMGSIQKSTPTPTPAQERGG